MPPGFSEFMRKVPLALGRGSVVGRILLGTKTVHIHDVLADREFVLHEPQKTIGLRTLLGVPLMREETPIGVLVLTRNAMRPFADKQIELVNTFADQAVIAIENCGCSMKSRTRAASLRRRASTSRSSSPI
jgi:GAF domain-containing protein